MHPPDEHPHVEAIRTAIEKQLVEDVSDGETPWLAYLPASLGDEEFEFKPNADGTITATHETFDDDGQLASVREYKLRLHVEVEEI